MKTNEEIDKTILEIDKLQRQSASLHDRFQELKHIKPAQSESDYCDVRFVHVSDRPDSMPDYSTVTIFDNLEDFYQTVFKFLQEKIEENQKRLGELYDSLRKE